MQQETSLKEIPNFTYFELQIGNIPSFLAAGERSSAREVACVLVVERSELGNQLNQLLHRERNSEQAGKNIIQYIIMLIF